MENKSDGHMGGNERDARRIRSMPDLCLSAVLLVCLGFQAATGVAQEAAPSLLTTNSPFVLYLENPPWIKEMRYVISKFNVAKSASGQILSQGWINTTNRLAIQPSGMFFETLNPNPVPFTEPASPTQLLVLGVSDRYVWQGNIDSHLFAFSSQIPEDGGSENNHLQIVTKVTQQWDINPVRYFGFPALRNNSFQLVGHDRFEAVTIADEPLAGEIMIASNNQVIQLKYGLKGNTNDYTMVTYKYGAGSELPNYLERKQLRQDGSKYGLDLTNWIEGVSYGTDSEIQKGYAYSMFFTNFAVFTQIVLESNGQRYLISQNGGMSSVNERFISPVFGKGHSRIVTIMFLIIFLAASVVFVWRISQRTENKKQP